MKQDELTGGQNSKGPMKQGPVEKGQNGSGLNSVRPNWLRTNWEDTDFKGCRMGRSDKVSLWYVSLLINTRFRFFFILE